MSPLICVIILNWQRPSDTIACVRSIQMNEVANLRLLVVDNGSQDDSIQMISKACPNVEILSLPENLGFAGGNNAGIEYAVTAAADYIFVLNNDTIVQTRSISVLVQTLEWNTTWAIAVPKICYYSAPERIWAAGACWKRFPPRVKMIGFGALDSPRYNHQRELEYATGCALLGRREVFEMVGGFNPDFVNYHEDYDFCYRARKVGYRLVYAPQSVILHKVSRSLGAESPTRWHYLGRNTVLFYRPGQRFSWSTFYSAVIWIIGRETLKGHQTQVAAFLRGVREGLALWQVAV